MRVNDIIKVHFYGTDKKEIKTRSYNKLFTVYNKNGKLGINWNNEHHSSCCNDEEFTPFETFSHTVIFENIKTGKKFYFDNISNSIKKTHSA